MLLDDHDLTDGTERGRTALGTGSTSEFGAEKASATADSVAMMTLGPVLRSIVSDIGKTR